jgi:hypothetical protein
MNTHIHTHLYSDICIFRFIPSCAAPYQRRNFISGNCILPLSQFPITQVSLPYVSVGTTIVPYISVWLSSLIFLTTVQRNCFHYSDAKCYAN